MSAPARPGRGVARRYFGILAPLGLLLAAVPLLSRFAGMPYGDFTRDVFSTAGLPVYTGIVSNVGVFLWGATAAVCGFAWWLAPGPPLGGRRAWLLATAAWSGILMVDDFFMFHEWIFPRATGLDEKVVLAAYAVGFVGYVGWFRRFLAEAPAGFAAAVTLFAASVGMDLVEPVPPPQWFYLTEEGFKLLGIGTWLAYFLGVAAGAVAPAQRSAQSTAASNSASPSSVSSRNVSS